MKRTIMLIMLAGLLIPASAYSNTDNQNRKMEIQTKYEKERNSENQSYDARVQDAKQKYPAYTNKLDDLLSELKIKHEKILDEIKYDEKLELQKVDERKSDYE